MDFASLGYIRVAAATPLVTIGDPTQNAEQILALAEELTKQDVALAVYPELCLTGYSAEDLFFSDELLTQSVRALARLSASNMLPMMIIGLPWRLPDARLLNCAAVLSQGKILGMVPKTTHPNHGEFYDLRWFTSGAQVNETFIPSHSESGLNSFQIRTDQLFKLQEQMVGIELCEDLWSPHPPSIEASLAGANIIANLSASNELIAKAEYRRDLVRMASARNIGAYVYASAGATESTKDVVFGGHNVVAENGALLHESDRFQLDAHYLIADIDGAHLAHDRTQNSSFGHAPRPRAYRVVDSGASQPPLSNLVREYSSQPFVPSDEHEFAARAQEILNIQTTGLARRMKSAHAEKLVIGLSGGLDSTLAFLVCVDALAKLSLPLENLVCVTMPGPGTTSKTLSNAGRLTNAIKVALKEIAIHDAVEQHLRDLEHQGEHDIVYENAQARERTQILFNHANQVGGIVVGTGDLSELALGWCTFNADHMASYNVNASVPKTMMAYLVRWYAQHRANPDLAAVLEDVLNTPISPELIPPNDDEISQHTESIVGPYELHDFFLFHYLRTGATPQKIYALACVSFAGIHSPEEIKHWLKQFFSRFFSQQFKRTTLPPGPKVGSVSLSPRGDWRMPDEASAEQMIAAVDKL